jgi:hypothetical protein
MLELERLNVRVVSGRAVKEEEYANQEGMGRMPNSTNPDARRGSITASLLNAADLARANNGGEWNGDNGMGGFDVSSMPQGGNSLSNQMMGDLSSKDDNVPPHRPLVGAGSAAAYEAARAEHYRELAEKKNKDQGSTSSNAMENGIMSNAMEVMQSGSLGSGMQQGLGGPSINANQHYEMLKLHHMNLLNEIQETTLMMNIYQQQQLQQQQQQQMQQQQMKEQQQMQQIQNSPYGGNQQNHMSQLSEQRGSSSSKSSSQSKQKKNSRKNDGDQPNTVTKSSSEDNGENSSSREDKLAKIKAEIEERKRMLEELVNGGDGPDSNKRAKTAV